MVYLRHKHNRRVDFLLHILLKISRDKVFEQLIKLEKGKYTHRVSEINKRHKSISTLEPLSENIQAIDDLSWNVSSARDGSITYVVKIVKETCTCNLRCSMCGACVHMYTCTCIDSTLHATVCKHAHAIKTMTSNPSIAFTPASQVDYFATILDDGGENSNPEEL